jgi:hypothetical protein
MTDHIVSLSRFGHIKLAQSNHVGGNTVLCFLFIIYSPTLLMNRKVKNKTTETPLQDQTVYNVHIYLLCRHGYDACKLYIAQQ